MERPVLLGGFHIAGRMVRLAKIRVGEHKKRKEETQEAQRERKLAYAYCVSSLRFLSWGRTRLACWVCADSLFLW
jgi:hypothetical protein